LKKFLDNVSEDLRRFGLVLIGGAFLTQGAAPVFRVLLAGLGILMMLTAYVIVLSRKEDQ
jgi:hypothetical protein